MSKRRVIASGMLGVTVAVILWLTVLNRDAIHLSPLSFRPFHSVMEIANEIREHGLTGNLFGNIILFLPVGILYPAAFKRNWKRVLLFGFCLSLMIEVSQLILRRGYFEVDDLICNTMGALIGNALYAVIKNINNLRNT